MNELGTYSDLIGSLREARTSLVEDINGHGTEYDFGNIVESLSKIEEKEMENGGVLEYARLMELMKDVVEELENSVGNRPQEGESAIEKELSNIIKDRADEEAIRTILSTLSTRVGTIFLVVFLVRILGTHFRYSARMAAHYESRGYMLSHGGISEADAMAVLATDEIQFEKTPSVPTSDIGRIVGKIVDALKKGM